MRVLSETKTTRSALKKVQAVIRAANRVRAEYYRLRGEICPEPFPVPSLHTPSRP